MAWGRYFRGFTEAGRNATSRRRLVAPLGFVALVGAVAASGCNPGAFDSLANREADAGSRPDASAAEVDAGSRDDAGTEKQDAGSDAGDHALPRAGTSGTSAGTGGAAAGSGGGAGSGGAGSSAAGAGGAPPKPPECMHPSDLTKVSVSSSDVGLLPMPAWVDQRTVTTTALVRDRVLLAFTVPSAFGMAGWTDAESLLSSPPHLDEQGPFVPLFESSAVAANLGLAVGSAVSDGDSALVYFADAQILTVGAAGIARLPLNGNRAEILRAAGALFPWTGVDPAPWRPVFYQGAVIVTEGDVDYIYVYGCQANPSNSDEAQGAAHESPCRLARVPRTGALEGDSYRYWNGQAWVADVTQAAIAIDHTSGSLSVSYNAYLGKYLAVNSGFWNSVTMRWADRPEGPWHALGEFDTVTASGGFGSTFSAIEVPALRDKCQRITYVSYANSDSVAPPDGGMAGVDYSTHFVRVELK